MAILILLAAPALLIWLAQRIPALDKLGVVPLAVLAGFAVALLINPIQLFGEGTQQTAAEVSVALALPLIIFATDIRTALRDARGAGRAIALAFVSVVAVSLLGVLLFKGHVTGLPQVAALSVGAYTGSGMNMGAINTAISGDNAIFLTMITYDIVFSALYMLVVLIFGQRLAGLILPPYPGDPTGAESGMAHLTDDRARSYNVILQRSTLPGSALVIGAAALCVALGVVVAEVLPASVGSVATILTITTLGLLGSMIPTLHRVRTSFPLGMYLVTVFVFASGTMLDLRIFSAMDWSLGGYFFFVIFGSMIAQALLSRVAGIDRDTYLIASGAAVMSVPFIPVIAGAIHNRALLVPGIAIAILGYALGNYLGVIVSWISASIL